MQKIDQLLSSNDPEAIFQGIEIAEILDVPIIIKQRPPREILIFVMKLDDPRLLTLMSDPATHKFIQARIARNQNTPIEVIAKIASDPRYSIRASNIAIRSHDLYCKMHPDDKKNCPDPTIEPRSSYDESLSESKNLLKQIIKEELSIKCKDKGRDLGYGEGEGRMSKSHLYKISEYAAELHEMLRDDDDLPEWVQSKISVMANNIGKIKHYLEYKILREEEL